MRPESWIERLPIRPARPWVAPALMLAAVGAALALRLALVPAIASGMAFVTFFPVILIVSFVLGARMGAIAAAISTILAWNFFVVDPLRPSFVATAVPALVPFLVLVTINLAIVHWLQTANAKLRRERARSAALAETRETLFRELQHRVSNNLQVAAGLLTLQKKLVGDETARTALDEASRRLGVIGRVSRQLYEASGATRPMQEYLAPLCDDVVEMSGRSGIAVLVRAADGVRVSPEAAVPLALIVAETVANAIEHGLAGHETGNIEVFAAYDADGALVIEVSDDGAGLPQGFDPAASGSLGLGIVRTFASQLGGSFAMEAGERTVARLVVPK